MHQRRRTGLIVLFAGILAALQALAQSDYRLRADSTLVVIPVGVTDASNHFVLNLEKDRFSVFEDGVKQRVTQFAGEDAPLSIGLLVDVSGSMGRKLAISQSAVSEFLKTMNLRDEEFLIEFSDHAELATGFTRDSNAIKDKMNSLQSAGLTALLDAVHLGLVEMKNAKNPRKALLILSDGGDNNSRYSASENKRDRAPSRCSNLLYGSVRIRAVPGPDHRGSIRSTIAGRNFRTDRRPAYFQPVP